METGEIFSSRRAILAAVFVTILSPVAAQSGRLRIRVTDKSGAVIPGATVSVPGPNGRPLQTSTSNESGEAVLDDLSAGECRFTVVAPGYAIRRLTVIIQGADEVKVDAVLNVAT